jgi:hypothetical protein
MAHSHTVITRCLWKPIFLFLDYIKRCLKTGVWIRNSFCFFYYPIKWDIKNSGASCIDEKLPVKEGILTYKIMPFERRKA